MIEDRAARVALASLPRIGPAQLRGLLARHGTPSDTWEAVRRRVDDPPVSPAAPVWTEAARSMDPHAALRRHLDDGFAVLVPGDDDWPPALCHDPEPPLVLFADGPFRDFARPAVALVGTRQATAHGRRVARTLGRGLGELGVTVVSGLALGIDGASHEGALAVAGPAVAVVASGLDVIYPARHRDLWNRVAASGVVISEWPLGTAPERWRFPARNRVVAGVSALVVVVESGKAGGSFHTVEAAIERGIDVMAVPGSVMIDATAGTNQLLAEGAGLVRGVDDIVEALGGTAVVPPSGIASGAATPVAVGSPAHEVAALDPDHVPLVRLVSDVPTPLFDLVALVGRGVEEVAGALLELEADGVVARDADGYVLGPRCPKS